jgi:glycosyltransferase involved in cell wall biosynthesis
MGDKLLCSVLVCTYNRAELLRLTLESFCVQSLDRDRFEVVVVDDGSSDGTAKVVERFASRLKIRYAYQRNSGLASARNHALFLAQSPIVLLQDDDDIAGPRLLEEHLATHQRYPEDHYAVLGFTNLSPRLASDPIMHFVTEVGQFLFSYPNLKDGQVLDFSYFWGGRSSCKRSFLLEHGVFNPVFRFGCEDIELAYRLSKVGFAVVYNSRAVSTTVRSFSFDEFCKRLMRQGRSNFIFNSLHADPAVRKWAEVETAHEDWSVLAPVYDALLRSARKLDEAYRRKMAAGLGSESDRKFLHDAYWAAFRASKTKGIVDKAQESGVVSPLFEQLLGPGVTLPQPAEVRSSTAA